MLFLSNIGIILINQSIGDKKMYLIMRINEVIYLKIDQQKSDYPQRKVAFLLMIIDP
jgi:hypothetical protein